MSVHIRSFPRILKHGIAGLALSASLACFALPASAQTLTAVMQSPLRALDPIVSSAAISNTHGYMIYDTLLGMDAEFNVQPQMADRWEVSADGKTYTFFLRDGLKWHDGAPVTAEDCVASIKRWGAVDVMGQSLMGLVTDMTVIDERSFSVTLDVPTNLILEGLAKIGTRTAFMMPKRIAETPASEQITEHVGSGPFRFVSGEFQPGIKVVYEKFDDYVPRSEPASWTAGGKVVKVDRVEWIAMPDALTTVNALLNNEVDFVENLPYDLMPMVESNGDFAVEFLSPLGLWTYYRFNFLHAPFDNQLVRRAAMYAVGQNDILMALTGDPKFFSNCAAIFGCGTPYASDYGADIVIEPNIEKAKELLAEAGYKNEPVVILHPTDNAQVSTQPVVIAAALRAAGFNVDLQSMDWQTLTTRRASKNPPSEGGWSIHTTTGPLIGITNPLINQTVATSGEKAWFGWPDFPEIEALRGEFARTSDPKRLTELSAEIQKKVIDEGVVVPLGQFVIPSGFSTKLSGVLKSPVAIFWNIEKAD
ncbi:MAG TPA: ABC transporter substrate-binding protein [Rhizobiaceae bacterium]|nr:ABC transporter substrate-binding protein [Rhizobiaceae bacterium]